MNKQYVQILDNLIKRPKGIVNGSKTKVKWNEFQKKVLSHIKDRKSITRFIWLYGALGGGKTFLGAYLTALFAITTPNTNLLVVREFKKQAIENNAQKIIDFFEANGLENKKDYVYNYKEGFIKVKLTNTTIYFEGARGNSLDSKIRSKEFYFAWLEEATFLTVENLKVINERVRGTINKLYGNPFILITNNPDNVSEMKEYLDDMVEKGLAIGIKTDRDDNDKQLGSYYDILDATMTEVEKEKMLKGNYNEDEPYFFSHISKQIEGATYHSLETELEKQKINKSELIHYIGFDEGITAKNALIYLVTDGYHFFVEDVKEFDIDGGYDDIVDEIKGFIKTQSLTREAMVVIDPALYTRKRTEHGVKKPSEILEGYGLNIMKGENDNVMFINIIKTLIKKKRILFNFYKSRLLITELIKWKKKYSKAERTYLDIPMLKQKYGDDALTSFKYALNIAFNGGINKREVESNITKGYYNLNDFTTYNITL